MKSVDQHLADVLAAVHPLPPLPLPLVDAHGCTLGEDVVATSPLPGLRQLGDGRLRGTAAGRRVGDAGNPGHASGRR